MKHKLTHGIQTECEHEGITRNFSLQRYENEDGQESFFIVIKTTGLHDEPIVTKISFSSIGYDLFCMFMRNAPYDLANFELPEVKKEEQT